MKTYIRLVICNLLLAVQTQGQGCSSSCCDRGYPGNPGPIGIQGVQGPGGIPGRPGKQGMHGYAGEKGDRGIAGEYGQTGVKGIKGIPGLPGPDGTWHGDDGEPGERGDTGDQGIKGIVGPTGPTGHHGRAGEGGLPGYLRVENPSSFHSVFDGLGVWATHEDFIVPFNLVMYNAGSGYERNTGKYTAPTNGTYYFSTTIHRTSQNSDLRVAIQLYDSVLSQQRILTYVILNNNEQDDSSTEHVITHLNKNDQVYVTISHEQFLVTDTRRKTTFTGFLLMNDH